MINKKLNNLKNYGIYLMLFSGAVLTSCNDDDDNGDDDGIFEETPEYAMLTLDDQHISQNTLEIESVTVPSDGFVVVHRDNGQGQPAINETLGDAAHVEEGVTDDIYIYLGDVDLSDGENLWVRVYQDSNNNGTFEYDGDSGVDNPFLDEDEMPVRENVTVLSPELMVSNQAVINNSINIDHVEAGTDGWIAVYNSGILGGLTGPDYSQLLGSTHVEDGEHHDVSVSLSPTVNYEDGQTIFVILHVDNGTADTFEFNGEDNSNDPIEYFGSGDNEISTSFEIEQ